MDSKRPVQQLHLQTQGPGGCRGVWSAEEHDRFLQALKRFPDGPWQQLALCVGTRSTRQVQTHAQKFFEKIRRRQRGLRRSYVHSGTSREHRVDEDVIALLSTAALSELTDENDEDSQISARSEHSDSNSAPERKQIQPEQSPAEAVRAPTSQERPPSKAKRRRPETRDDATTDPTLPQRIRIRRSARNALQRGQLFMPDVVMDTAPVAPLAFVSDEPEAAASDLPSIEEALDFFLYCIGVDVPVRTRSFTEV